MGHSTRVLVVDDEPGVRMTVAANLDLAGLDVVTASTGREAIAAASTQGPFDLVLTDLRMPQMSGAELIRRLRQVQPGIPMILMTAYAREDLVSELYGAGLFTVLSKPFDVDDVVNIVVRATKRPFVLVVEETHSSRAELVAALTAAGLRTLTAQSAGEALLVIEINRVDVCIVEAALGGATLIPDLLARNPEMRVIAISGRGAREQLSTASKNGAFGCMERPIEAPELVRMIARARGVPLA